MLRGFPDIDVYKHGYSTALYYAAKGGHTDAVKLLLKNNAKVLPSKPQVLGSVGTPIHSAINRAQDTKTSEIVQLLLEADDSPECIKFRDS